MQIDGAGRGEPVLKGFFSARKVQQSSWVPRREWNLVRLAQREKRKRRSFGAVTVLWPV